MRGLWGKGEREGGGSISVQELVRRYIDGVASDGEVADLNRLVATDPTVAEKLALAATLESSLEVLLRAPDGEALPRLTADDVSDLGSWRGRRFVRPAPVAAVTVALAIAAAFLLAGPLRHRDSRVESAASVRRTDAPAIPTAGAPAPPAAPATAASAEKPTDGAPSPQRGPRRLRFADGSSAELRDEASRLETRVSKPRAIDLVLVQGAARFDVNHRPGRRFRIWIASTYVEVVGTVFSVERLAGSVRVSVERGLVKVVRGSKTLQLAAGTEKVLPVEVAEDERLASSRSRRATGAGAKDGSLVADDEATRMLEESEEARRLGHPAEAYVLLQRFLDRYRGDSRAFYVTFIAGRVLLEELARPREAAAAFAKVEALNSRTPLVQDALAREVESWCRAGDADMARQRARAFLRRYPNGRRADEVRRYGQLE